MEDQEFSKYRNPIEYLKVFFRRKWLFIAPAFIGTTIGAAACFLLPPTWESSTIILVEEEKIINPLFQNLAVSTSAAQRMQSIRESILSWNSLVELAKKLDLAKNAQSQAEYERLIMNLKKDISVQMRQHNIIRLAYEGKTPKETQLVAKTLTDILVEKNMRAQTKETDVAIAFITEQLAIYKRKIKESEIANLQDQLKNLLEDSTEQHPIVKEIRQKIDTELKELDSGEYKITGTEQAISSPAREALKKELDKLVQDKAAQALSGGVQPTAAESENDANKSIYKLLLMDRVDTSLARDINVNVSIYNMLLEKLETAKITQRLETSKEGTRYTILDPPRLPLKPIKPKKVLVVLLGFFFGAASGTGLVFGKEFMDQSFLDIEDTRHTLSLPVLGAISRITTQEAIDKEKNRRKVAIAASIVLASASVIGAALFSLLKK